MNQKIAAVFWLMMLQVLFMTRIQSMHCSGDSRLTAIAKRRVKPVDRMLAWAGIHSVVWYK
jgi:hypothetical protein